MAAKNRLTNDPQRPRRAFDLKNPCLFLCTEYSDGWAPIGLHFVLRTAIRTLMDRSVVSSLRIRAILILLSFIALQAICVSRAVASCGDWLAHSTSMFSSAPDDNPSRESATKGTASSDQSQSRRTPAPAPCRGPYCRSVPAQPAPPLPPRVVPKSSKLALAGKADFHEVDGHFARVRDDFLAHSLRGFPPGIERPPRT